MKKTQAVAGALAVFCAAGASAAPGLDMAWGGCPVTLSNPSDVSDPCTDDGGYYYFYLAFKAPAGISKLVSETFRVDVQSSDPILPDWWHLETGGCRAGSFGFNTLRNLQSTSECKDYWGITSQPGGVNLFPGRVARPTCSCRASSPAASGPPVHSLRIRSTTSARGSSTRITR